MRIVSDKKQSPTVSFIRRKKQQPENDDEIEEHRQNLLKAMEHNLARDFEEYKTKQGVMQLGPSIVQSLFAAERTLFLALIIFRILNALFVQTYYVPDEYWQSVEVAHNSAFGYGYLTWEWKLGIRSYLYPMVFSLAFRILHVINADNWSLIIKLPRIIQAVFAALTDFYLFKLSQKISGRSVAKWTLLCQLMSWFVFYSSTRTLTNNMEALLTVLGFYFYPNLTGKPDSASRQWLYIAFVTLGFAIRPTAVVQFLPLVLHHAAYLLDRSKPATLPHRLLTILRLFMTAFLILVVSIWIDNICYGKWTISTYNFVQLNVFQGVGSFYGTHPWHWYITQGLPVILASILLPMAVGFYLNRDCRLLQATFAWTVLVYSLLPHKEFRFLYPVMPIAMHFAGAGMNHVWQMASKEKPTQEGQSKRRNWIGNSLLVILLATNLPLACYTSLVHQRGTVDVMRLVREHASDMLTHHHKTPSILYLMPCHSTPFYSHVHLNVSMRFLTCEPNVFGQVNNTTPNYIDEADRFYEDPMAWLRNEYPLKLNSTTTNTLLPTLIVMFADLQHQIREFLTGGGYHECGRIFHTQFVNSARLSSHILAFCPTLPHVQQRHK